MGDLENKSTSDEFVGPPKPERGLITIEKLLEYRKTHPVDPRENDVECPQCHHKYYWQVLTFEPFRTITDDDGRNKQEVCEDCYWAWVNSDPSKTIARYFSNIEETPDGIVYRKKLTQEFNSI